MRQANAAVWCLLLASAGRAGAQQAIPDWLAPYPGGTTDAKAASTPSDMTYDARAPLADVITHYRGLFGSAGLAFHPEIFGNTAVIRANAKGCNVLIQAWKKMGGTSVHVVCAEHPAIQHITEGDILQGMAKYDQPVYPRPRSAMPSLTWPPWLARWDGVDFDIRRGVDTFKLQFLSAEFDSTWDRASIQRYFADLLKAHDYRVYLESSALVEGAHSFSEPGPRFVIRVEITPVNGMLRVYLRITAHQ